MAVINALTVDVEDYFHVSAFSRNISSADWDNLESRVERNTYRLLSILDAHGVKATFFVLGWVAERHPKLVEEIASLGHEVACHGYSHQLIYGQDRTEFKRETLQAKAILEDIVERPVIGYRAASYSITRRSLWALDILMEAGFKYDSSIFPVRHDRYGIPDAPTTIHRIGAPGRGGLIEVPLATFRFLGFRLPVAGGGYFRLYPYVMTRMALRSINKECQQPFVFYLHPWEIDPSQPRMKGSVISTFRHYNNLGKCEERLGRLLRDFDFTTVVDVLTGLGQIDSDAVEHHPRSREHPVASGTGRDGMLAGGAVGRSGRNG